MNGHKKVKLVMVVKAKNVVTEMTPVIKDVLRKGRNALSITDLNLLK